MLDLHEGILDEFVGHCRPEDLSQLVTEVLLDGGTIVNPDERNAERRTKEYNDARRAKYRATKATKSRLPKTCKTCGESFVQAARGKETDFCGVSCSKRAQYLRLKAALPVGVRVNNFKKLRAEKRRAA
jgi:hypothetical protein